MPWRYNQRTGELAHGDELVAVGYSGFGDGQNNPDLQDKQNVGPLPRGEYDILPPRDTASHGPYVLPLVPDPKNEMFGRAGFLMHGDSVKHPGHGASHGCIIAPRAARILVWESGDHRLIVFASEPDAVVE